MNSKNKKVYDEIFKEPVQSSIKWDDIEKVTDKGAVKAMRQFLNNAGVKI